LQKSPIHVTSRENTVVQHAAQAKFFAIFSTNVTKWITCSVFIANLQRIASLHIRHTFPNIFQTNPLPV